MSDPILLFVGADGSNCDLESQAVLEWSVRKHASQPVSITWMQQARKGPWAKWNCGSGRTPFSHFRWSLPAVCEFEGRAIYTDSDFIFTADIADLWQQPIPGVLLLKSPEGKLKTCSMLFDCAKAKGIVPTLDKLRADSNPNDRMLQYFRGEGRVHLSAYEGNWNCIDGESYPTLTDPRIKAIHYSRMEHQPHILKYALPRLKAEGRSHWYTGEITEHPRAELQALFDGLLVEAIANGFPPEKYRVEPFDVTRRNFTYSHQRGA